jgi:Flp pilus assembly protein TadD
MNSPVRKCLGRSVPLRLACAILLAGIRPALGGPKEDGDAAFMAGNNAGAVAAYTQALVANPDDASALIGQGRSLQNLGKRAEAAADFERAVLLAPGNSEAWRGRGLARYFAKDLPGALTDLNRAVELNPKSVMALENRAVVHVALKDYQAGIVDCTRAIQIQPDYVTGYNERGIAWQFLKDEDSALRDFETAIKLDPRNIFALTHRAIILEGRGEKEKAAQEYRIVLALDPKEKDAANHLAKLQNASAAATAKGTEAPAKTAPAVVQGMTPARSASVTATKSTTAAPAPEVSAAVPRTASAANTTVAPHVTAPSGPAAMDTSSPSVASHQPSAAPESSGPTAPGAKANPTSAAKGPAVPTPQPNDVAAKKSGLPASDAAKSGDQSRQGKPALPVATVVPTPISGYFKLVKVESGFAKDGTLLKQTGINTVGSGKHTWSGFDNKGPTTYGEEVRWSVPNALVPGVAVRFHLEMSVIQDCFGHGRITLMAPHGAGWYTPKCMVCTRNWPKDDQSEKVQSNLADDFDLTLPKELPKLIDDFNASNPDAKFWKAQSGKTTFQVRDQRAMVEIGGPNNSQITAKNPPSTLPLEDCSLMLRDWLDDLVVEIRCDDAAPLARYTYSWIGSGGSDHSLLVELLPGPKKDFRADGTDGIYVHARVNPKDASDTAAAQAATAAITFTAEGADSNWVDLHYKPEVRDGWQVTMVQASYPNAARGGPAKPPATLTIMAHAQKGNEQLTQTLDIPVAPDADIDAKPDLVDFTSGSGDSAKVTVTIDNAGPDRWDFHANYDKTSRKLALTTIKAIDGKSATLTLKEAGLDPLHDGSNKEQALLKITAEQKGRATLERDIKVNVFQEGLFVSMTGRDPEKNIFLLNGDGKGHAPTEIDVRVYAKDPKTKKIVNLTAREETLKQLTLTPLDIKGSVASNVMEVGGFNGDFPRVRKVSDPAAVLSLTLPKEVPADGRIVPCDFKITYTGDDGASFSSIVTLGVVTTSDGPDGSNWQVELDRCQEVITKFVPATYYPRMQAMLDQRKMTLGAEGLAKLRRKIWSAATELTLGEGGQGFASEAAWAGAITDVLEWSQWAGDMAFNAVIGTWTGPYGAAGAGMLKGALVSAINAYQAGESADEWLWENLGTIRGTIEGQIIDPAKFQEWGMESKAKAWALYVSYHFLKNLHDGQTVVEALKNIAKEASGNVLGAWLGEEVKAHGNSSVTAWAGQKSQQIAATMAKFKSLAAPASPAPKAAGPAQPRTEEAATRNAETETRNLSAPAKPRKTEAAATEGSSEPAATPEGPTGTQTEAAPRAPEPAAALEPPAATQTEPAPATPEPTAPTAPAAEPTPAQTAEVVALVRENTTHGLSGRPQANLQVVLAIMTDPTMVRALKKAPADVQQAFSNSRETIYRWHDGEIAQHVKDTVPGMQDRRVKVLEFRTPGDNGLSLNTDRDYRVCYMAGRHPNGDPQWIEVPRKHWEDKSYETFARLTGGPTDSAAASKQWAVDHQQLATDKYHPEASAAFSDQKTVWNETARQFERVQVIANVREVAGIHNKQKWNPQSKQWDTVPEEPALTPAVGADEVIPPPADPARVNLEDPQSLGQMYQLKVHDAAQPQEAYVQANKAVEKLVALRKGYNLQGRDIGTVPPQIVAGMEAVAEVTGKLKADPNCRDPKALVEAENKLRAQGFSNLGDFMNKLGGQFEAFKNM